MSTDLSALETGCSAEEASQRLFDDAGSTLRVKITIALIAVQFMCEVFDYFIAGFIVSAVAPAWRLTFGQTAIILLAGGGGTIFGSAIFGGVADRIGRKPVFVGCAIVYSLSAGAIALTPTGAWPMFAALRFCVGVAFSAAGLAQIPYVSEVSPRARRALMGGLIQIPISLGLLVAAFSASTLLPVLGWRGLAALGCVPILVALLLAAVAPESMRWQVSRGRHEAARKTLRTLLGREVDLPLSQRAETPYAAVPVKPLGLLRHRRTCAFIVTTFFCAGMASNGVLLWGPTILANVLRVSPAKAAGGFVLVSLAGIGGRILFTAAPHWLGRRACGQLMGYAGGLTLATAALFPNAYLAGASVLLITLSVSSLFFDGGFANLQPHPPEMLPIRLGGRGIGLSQASLGLARLVTPVMLAFIAGSNNLISPKSTAAAVTPSLLCLATAMFGVGLSYTFLTRGRHSVSKGLATASAAVATMSAGRARGAYGPSLADTTS